MLLVNHCRTKPVVLELVNRMSVLGQAASDAVADLEAERRSTDQGMSSFALALHKKHTAAGISWKAPAEAALKAMILLFT